MYRTLVYHMLTRVGTERLLSFYYKLRWQYLFLYRSKYTGVRYLVNKREDPLSCCAFPVSWVVS
jgi:hypothetical protein